MKERNWDEIKAKYEALLPIEELDGERTFLSRVGRWENFLKDGEFVIKDLESVEFEGDKRINRSVHPKLYDLLKEVFI